MGFFEEIKRSLSVGGIEPLFRAVIIGDEAGYFEGIKTVKKYTPSEVVFTVKGGEIKVRGECLVLKKYCAGDVAVCGKITAVERD